MGLLVWGRPRNVGAKALVCGTLAVVAGGSFLIARLPNPLDSVLLAKGTAAPELILNDVHGEPVRLSSFRGRPVVLNFMATWCGPCQNELPVLAKAARRLADAGLAVIGVNVGEQAPRVAAFARENDVPYPLLVDPDESVARRYAVAAFPTTYFIDSKGVVRRAETGAFENSPQGQSRFDWTLRSSLGESLAAIRREKQNCRESPDSDPIARRGADVAFQLSQVACACGCDLRMKDCRCDAKRGGQAMRVYLDHVLEDPDFTPRQGVYITQMKFRFHGD